MTKKDAQTIQAELARPFAPEDLEWRLQRAFECQRRSDFVVFAEQEMSKNGG